MEDLKVVRLTPPAEELLLTPVIRCDFSNCDSTFTNAGNYEMHLKRHHKVQPDRDATLQRQYYCPQVDCNYHITRTTNKHFKSIKYLRQHYQKVHAPKMQKCEHCGKGFTTISQLEVHKHKLCGVKFVCKVCGWDYASMEALLTHGKRKGHVVRDEPSQTNKLLTNKKAKQLLEQKVNQHQQTQTEVEPPIKRHCVGVSTDELSVERLTVQLDFEPSNVQVSLPRTIETQTEYPIYNAPTDSSNLDLPAAQLLPPSTHMYTQTYDDFFADSLLEFTDIQTQTNWSSFTAAAAAAEAEAAVVASEHYASDVGVGTCTRSAYDELLVSTETQTSFTQCLLDSRTTSGDAEEGAFINLYQTQHTQTCDMLLEGLFGGQESDLIGSFQSTYTQT